MKFLAEIIKQLPEAGRLTEIPAARIDRVYLQETHGILSKYWRMLELRLLYTCAFLPLATIDLNVSLVLGINYAFRSFFTSDERQKKAIAAQTKYATIFSKNLYALLASSFGLWSPKLVAFYFTPEKTKAKGVTAGGQYYRAENAERVYPTSSKQIQSIIQQAIEEGKKVMAVGAGRSQGKQFLPEGGTGGIVVDLGKFKKIKIHVKEKTAVIRGGVTWAELQAAANKENLAVLVAQASNIFSVIAALAGPNAHGWNHKIGVVANTIIAIKIINAKGEKQWLTPNDKLFHYIIGGYGLFGIVYKVKMQLANNDLLIEQGKEIPIQEYVNYFNEEVLGNDDIEMHLYRLPLDLEKPLTTGIAVNYVKVSNDEAFQNSTKLAKEPPDGGRTDRVLVNLARRFPLARSFYWGSEKKRLALPSLPQTRNEIMRPPINAMFSPSVSEAEWLQEYFLAGENVEPFLQELQALLRRNKVTLLNRSVRFVAQYDKSPLSYCHDGHRFSVVICFNQSLDATHVRTAAKWLRESQKLVVEKYKGTYYLPYQHISDPEIFRKAYPYADQAMEMKEEVDPDALFSSGLYQTYLKPTAETNYFKKIMKSKKTKDAFAGFLKVVLQRVDVTKFYALLEDILKYKDNHADIYQELCHRLPEIMPAKALDLYHIFSSLSAIKHDLRKQAALLLPENITTIDGLVEIGYPGRFVGGFRQHFNVSNITAVYEAPSITDYMQTGFPKPYDRFEKLDYKNPTLKNLQDSSADVITCYIGLHHFPKDRLDHFLKEVRRVLHDGGLFILVDHDVVDEESLAMAHMAHTVYNAVSGVSLEEEMHEIRRFKPISYWRSLLARYGLNDVCDRPDVPMIREGDPSRNRMVCLTKTAIKLDKGKEKVEEEEDMSEEQKEIPVIDKERRQEWKEYTLDLSVGSSKDALFGENANNTSGIIITEHDEEGYMPINRECRL